MKAKYIQIHQRDTAIILLCTQLISLEAGYKGGKRERLFLGLKKTNKNKTFTLFLHSFSIMA